MKVRCSGGSDGQARVSLSGGIAPVTLLWNDGNTTHQRTGLSAGTYWVQATDSLGNIASDTIVLNEPNPLVADAQRLTYVGGYHISKTGASDGQISVSVSGGVAPYQIIWEDSTHGFTKLNLAAGTYSYTVRDANNCTLQQSVTLNEPPPLVVQVIVLSAVTCKEMEDGSAQVQITGGVPPYKIQWSSGERDSIAYQLGKDNQQVTVFDAQGAYQVEPFSIAAPPTFQETILVSQYPGGYQVSCANCFNGSIEVQVEGGTPPYSVVWEDTSTVSNPFFRQNLGGKLYQYTIVDSNQCKIKGYVDLAEPKFKGWQLSGNTEIDANSQYLGTNDSSSFVVKTNAELALKINGEGNLGIGAEPTTAKLNVNGLLEGQAGIKLPNLNTFNDTAAASLQNFRLLAVDENGNFAKLGNSFPVADLLPNTTRCKLTQNNEYLAEWLYQMGEPSLATIGTEDCRPMVGIGTISPQARLDVNGAGFLRQGLQVGGSYLYDSDYPVNFNLPVKVSGNNKNSLLVQNTQSADYGYAAKIEVDRATTKAFSISHTSENFIVYGDGTTIIGNDPNITMTPDKLTLLAVMGLITAKEVYVKVDEFPDYVFDEGYCLESIDDVAQFIKKNKHLPNVSPASQVIENGGINLGDMQITTIEKIEELYLYIIQLNDRITELEKENRLLNNRN